jgi:hypothetical protein
MRNAVSNAYCFRDSSRIAEEEEAEARNATATYKWQAAPIPQYDGHNDDDDDDQQQQQQQQQQQEEIVYTNRPTTTTTSAATSNANITADEQAKKDRRKKKKLMARAGVVRYCSLFPATTTPTTSSTSTMQRSIDTTKPEQRKRKRLRTSKQTRSASESAGAKGDAATHRHKKHKSANVQEPPATTTTTTTSTTLPLVVVPQTQATTTTTSATTTSTSNPTINRLGSFCVPESPPLPAKPNCHSILVAESQPAQTHSVLQHSPHLSSPSPTVDETPPPPAPSPAIATLPHIRLTKQRQLQQPCTDAVATTATSTTSTSNRYLFRGGAPPSNDTLMQSITSLGQPEVIYPEPYYSQPQDQPPSAKVFGGRVFSLHTNELKYLPEFRSRPLLLGERSTATTATIRQQPRPTTTTTTTTTPMAFTLARAPPLRSTTDQWLSRDAIQQPNNPNNVVLPTAPSHSACAFNAKHHCLAAATSNKPVLATDQSPRRLARMLASQIEGCTPATGKEHQFCVDDGSSGGGANNASSTTATIPPPPPLPSINQHLTTMSIEVHVNTRGNLRPNPVLDAVTSRECRRVVSDAERHDRRQGQSTTR